MAQNGFSTEGRVRSSTWLQSQTKMLLLSLKRGLFTTQNPTSECLCFFDGVGKSYILVTSHQWRPELILQISPLLSTEKYHLSLLQYIRSMFYICAIFVAAHSLSTWALCPKHTKKSYLISFSFCCWEHATVGYHTCEKETPQMCGVPCCHSQLGVLATSVNIVKPNELTRNFRLFSAHIFYTLY